MYIVQLGFVLNMYVIFDIERYEIWTLTIVYYLHIITKTSQVCFKFIYVFVYPNKVAIFNG